LPVQVKAQKEQVAFMVQRLLGIKKEIKPLDISDAMAVAITHAQRIKIRKSYILKKFKKDSSLFSITYN